MSVVTYTDAADAPVEKGALVAKIRAFEGNELYETYSGLEEIVNAKATYENAAATEEEVEAAIAGIDSLIDRINAHTNTVEEIFSYDFTAHAEDTADSYSPTGYYAANKTARETVHTGINTNQFAGTLSRQSDAATYDIGDYIRVTTNNVRFPLNGGEDIDRAGAACLNRYLEISFDIKPETVSAFTNSAQAYGCVGILGTNTTKMVG